MPQACRSVGGDTPSMPFGASDRRLDESTVSLVVAQQFPEFEGQEAVRFGEGWDNEAFLLGGEWVFRFPRRANRVPWQQREEMILATVARPLGSLVPDVLYRGRPCEHFPYPFIGYRRLRGVAADTAGVSLDRLALQIADLFGRVHGLDPSGLPPTPAGWEQGSPQTLAREVVTKASLIHQALLTDRHDAVDHWLRGGPQAPKSRSLSRLCHNDISAEHILVESDGTISGLIDWTDAIVTDPAVDFVGLITIAGWPFIDQVLDSYSLPRDPEFVPRLEWLARAHTLRWLAEAVENNETTERHLTWVQRAFADSNLGR